MATMSFTVPDAVRDRFEAVFAGRDRSAVVAELLIRAIAMEERRRRLSRSLVERLRRVDAGDRPPADDWIGCEALLERAEAAAGLTPAAGTARRRQGCHWGPG